MLMLMMLLFDYIMNYALHLNYSLRLRYLMCGHIYHCLANFRQISLQFYGLTDSLCVDQEAAWFESYLCVSYASYISTSLKNPAFLVTRYVLHARTCMGGWLLVCWSTAEEAGVPVDQLWLPTSYQHGIYAGFMLYFSAGYTIYNRQ